jgi:general secretion pathway protein H
MHSFNDRPALKFGTALTLRELAYLSTHGAMPIYIVLLRKRYPMRLYRMALTAAGADRALRPTSPTSRTDRAAGFTLIEVMAVMLIIALAASLVMTLVPGTGRAKLKSVTLETAALLRRERLGAILTGHDREVVLDGDHRRLIGQGGGVVTIPSDVVLDILGAQNLWQGRRSIVRFHADGASSGAVLRLSREEANYEIRVNWFTGGVAIGYP